MLWEVRATSAATVLAALLLALLRPRLGRAAAAAQEGQGSEDGSLWKGVTAELEKTQTEIAKRMAFEREQRELLRDFRKIITKELTQAEISKMRVIVLIVEANLAVQQELVDLCHMQQYQCAVFSDFKSADEHLQDLNQSLSPMKALLDKTRSPQRSPSAVVGRTRSGVSPSRTPRAAKSPTGSDGQWLSSALSATWRLGQEGTRSVSNILQTSGASSGGELTDRFRTLSTSSGDHENSEEWEAEDANADGNSVRSRWKEAVRGTRKGARFHSAVSAALKAERERERSSKKRSVRSPRSDDGAAASSPDRSQFVSGSSNVKSPSEALSRSRGEAQRSSTSLGEEELQRSGEMTASPSSVSVKLGATAAATNAGLKRRWQAAVRKTSPGGRFQNTVMAALEQARTEERSPSKVAADREVSRERARQRWEKARAAFMPGYRFKRMVSDAIEASKNKKNVVYVMLMSAGMLEKVPELWQPGEAFVALTADPEELDQLARSLGVFREGELQERLRARGVGVTLLNPLSVKALTTTVHTAVHQHVADEYLLVKVLGRGATGTVYKTRRVRDEKWFALKEINFKRMSEKVLAEAEAEAELLGKLKWPTVLTLVDSWRSEADRIVYLLMPMLDGGNLDERMSHAKEEGKKLREEQVLEWYAQAVHGLSYLHANGVLHRDLKPANLFLAADGRGLRIGDLGSAVSLPGGGPHPALRAHVEGGPTTRWYAGPEVCETRRHYAASDVFALGASFADLLALKAGFVARAFYAKEPMAVPPMDPLPAEKEKKTFGSREGVQSMLVRFGSKDGSKPSSATFSSGQGQGSSADKEGRSNVRHSSHGPMDALAALFHRQPSLTSSKDNESDAGSDFAEIGENEEAHRREPEAMACLVMAEVRKRPAGIEASEATARLVARLLHWDFAARPAAAELASEEPVLKRIEVVLAETGLIRDEFVLQAHLRDFGKLRKRSLQAHLGSSSTTTVATDVGSETTEKELQEPSEKPSVAADAPGAAGTSLGVAEAVPA